jgi:hypothetical protein
MLDPDVEGLRSAETSGTIYQSIRDEIPAYLDLRFTGASETSVCIYVYYCSVLIAHKSEVWLGTDVFLVKVDHYGWKTGSLNFMRNSTTLKLELASPVETATSVD